MNGISLARKLLVRFKSLVPSDLRTYYQPFIYGLVGGLSAVAFQVVSQSLFRWLWIGPSRSLGLAFIPISFGAIISTAIIAGLILTYVSKEAAGSGVPQVKTAFWRDFGYLPFRVVLAKFFGCVITIGGGSSLGREGPTVHIAGALASNVAGLLGAPKQERRPALLAGAAAGLAAAFNTPLSAITFVLEEIMEDLNSTRYLAPVLIASVTSTFVAHLFLGDNPAFRDSGHSTIFLEALPLYRSRRRVIRSNRRHLSERSFDLARPHQELPAYPSGVQAGNRRFHKLDVRDRGFSRHCAYRRLRPWL